LEDRGTSSFFFVWRSQSAGASRERDFDEGIMTALIVTDAISEKHLSDKRRLRSVDREHQARDEATRAQRARLHRKTIPVRRAQSDKR
jgi:hypothetical protein